MKNVQCYLRIAKSSRGFKFTASPKQNYAPLSDIYASPHKKYYPTINLCLNLELPNDAFDAAEKELQIKLEDLRPATKISVD